MSVQSVIVGGVTTGSALIKARATSGEWVHARVSPFPDLDEPDSAGWATDPVQPGDSGVASVLVENLEPDSNYFYVLVLDGVEQTELAGRLRTHPDGPASFSFGVTSCAGSSPLTPGEGDVLAANRLSNHQSFDDMRRQAIQHNWAFMAHLGDMHYYDIGSGVHVTGHSEATFRRAWEDVLTQPRQHRLYREVPLVYMWDDHDYGPNDSGRQAPGRLNVQAMYRERFPSYDLPAAIQPDGNAPVYHSFTVGRVLFLVSDTRSSRDPNDDPDDIYKTMLGEQQKDWMRGVLTRSSASLLVWLTPTPWIDRPPLAWDDTWSGFKTEASELVDMFRATGWADRMIVVTGDTHHMAMDSGAGGATLGGLPMLVCGPMDSRPNQGGGVPYDLGVVGHPERGQHMEIRVTDDGGPLIEVTATGWIGARPWVIHTTRFAVLESAEILGGEGRSDVAVAEPSRWLTWYACDLVTGRVIAALPDAEGSFGRALGAYTSTSVTLPIPEAGPAALPIQLWRRATEPGITVLCPEVHSKLSAAFLVLERELSSEPVATLACASLEAYLDRRFVGDHRFDQVDQVQIARRLIQSADTQGIGITLDPVATGVLRDRTYEHEDDATIYSRVRELSDVAGGLEWTIDVDWASDDRERVLYVARLRQEIGEHRPHALLTTESDSVLGYTYTESYADGDGANHVIATGSSGETATEDDGEDEPRAESRPMSDVADGWPRYERRWSPSSSIESQRVLDDHARRDLELRAGGIVTVSFTLRWQRWPRLHVDWQLGDTIPWHLVGPAHPEGLSGQSRVIGWELDPAAGVVTPTLHHTTELLLAEEIINPPDSDEGV